MTNAELARAIAKECELKMDTVNDVLNAFKRITTETVASGEKVMLHEFGTFNCKVTKERMGRNPSTGQAILIPQRKKITFEPGSKTRKAIEGA